MLKNKVLVRFLVLAGALYVVWHLVYQQYLEKEGTFIKTVAAHVAAVSVSILKAMGYEAATAPYNGFDTLITLSGKNLVWIDSGCTGLTLMALFAGFIFAYPGPLVRKAWYIPAGLFVIYLVNLIRVVALAINHIHSNSTFDFNHKYTYTLATYAAIFGLWMLWANRLSGVSLSAVDDVLPPGSPPTTGGTVSTTSSLSR
jgi:exosortase family protein XrtF